MTEMEILYKALLDVLRAMEERLSNHEQRISDLELKTQ